MKCNPLARDGLRLTVLCSALLLAHAAHADALDDITIKASGFGTIDGVHSSNDTLDFVGNRTQPDGPGYSKGWTMSPDSRVGVQFDGQFTSNLSGVLQIVSQYNYQGAYTPEIEWANLKYQVTPDWSVRVGRTALPVYMVSDTRLVGYANPWVRPPLEVYNAIPITNSDGIDTSYRFNVKGVGSTLQAFYGGSFLKFPDFEGRASQMWGINDTLDFGDLTVRAGYFSAHASFYTAQALYSGLNGFGAALSQIPPLAPIGQTALNLATQYSASDVTVTETTLGAIWDPGTWLVQGEFADGGRNMILEPQRAAYVTAGYHFGPWLPYVTYSKVTSTTVTPAEIPTTGLPAPVAGQAAALNAALKGLVQGTGPAQNTISIGTRWDVMRNVDLKFQVDRVSFSGDSTGEFRNAQPNFQPGSHATVVSLAADFVF